MGKYEIQIQKPRILVSRILRRHRWKKCKENRGIYQESIEGR